MSIKLFYAKIKDNIFEGHIEVQHYPECDFRTKQVWVHLFNCTVGATQVTIPDFRVNYRGKLDDPYERWDFNHSLAALNPSSETIVLNFALWYEFKVNGQPVTYWDNNEGKNYLVGQPGSYVTSFDTPGMALGKSAIALYDSQVAPCHTYTGTRTTCLYGASFYLKNLVSHKDAGIHYSTDTTRQYWSDIAGHWKRDFDKAKNGEELWELPRVLTYHPTEFCLFCSYDDKPPAWDNNFKENYTV